MVDPLTLYVVWKLFGDKKSNGAAARPADVHVPPVPAPNGHAAHNGHALPAPQPTQPVVQPAQPTFPSNVVVPPPVPLGYKKGVEVWQVKPEIAMSAGLLAGAAPAQAAVLSLPALEQAFPNGWTSCKVVTATEVATAKSLLNQWRDGGIVFLGPGTLQGRRAYRMAKHPTSSPAPQPAPQPGPTTPAAVTTPAPAPTPPPAPPGSDEASLPPDARRPAPPPPAPRVDLPATIRRGSSGGSVKRLQGLLNAGLVVDGKFGPKTEAAVKAYQRAHGLTVDGIVGPQTWASLIGQ